MRVVLINKSPEITELKTNIVPSKNKKAHNSLATINLNNKDLTKNQSNSRILSSKPQIISHKEIKVHMKKFVVNKADQDKYNLLDDNKKSNIISNDLPKGIINKNVSSLKINEILKPSTLQSLKDDFEKTEIVKSNLNKVDEQHFRSVFEPSNKNKFRAQLEKNIERDKTNLIKYLHSKDNVSKLLIEKLSSLDEGKISKMNRICKIYFHYENFDKRAREKIKEKLEDADKMKKKSIQQNVDLLGKNLTEGDIILKQYKNKKVHNKKAYEDIHHFFKVKYWNNLPNNRIYQNSENTSY